MKFSNLFKVGALLWGMSCAIAVLATPVEVSKPQEAIPPNIVTTANKPMVMLAASKDHTLFGPIYTDFEDLDGDGYLDTTYLPTFKYYGYFDSETCYSYSTTNRRFAPVAEATKVAVTVGSITKYKYTCSGRWSGNFSGFDECVDGGPTDTQKVRDIFIRVERRWTSLENLMPRWLIAERH